MERIEDRFSVSERRACEVAGQHRSVQRYVPLKHDSEQALLERLRELVGENPRRGCRYITAVLRAEGWAVNRKRIHRLWKQEGYKVPKKRRKKRAVGNASNACDKRSSTGVNDVWTWDFIHDRLMDGRALKCLVIVDEYTRECLELGMARSIEGRHVLDVLARLIGQRGAPAHIRSDNGSEFIATQVRTWLDEMAVDTMYIEPGAPWQNGYAEAFNSRLRDEFLEMNYFTTLREAQELARLWKEHYNTKRLHSALDYQAPAEFARHCGASGYASLRSAPPTPPQWQPQADEI